MLITIKDLVKDYERVKLEILALEARADELKEIILPHMNPDEKIQLKEGKLYLKPRPTWKFSPHVTGMEDAVKEAKKEEQANGTAEMTQTYVLEYRRDKKEEAQIA